MAYLKRLANDARALDGWPGPLVGDMARPRGGPMITGHESHKVPAFFIIEVQSGAHLDEDDIVRVDDIYRRDSSE